MLNAKQELIVLDPSEALDGVFFSMMAFQLLDFVGALCIHSDKLNTLLGSESNFQDLHIFWYAGWSQTYFHIVDVCLVIQLEEPQAGRTKAMDLHIAFGASTEDRIVWQDVQLSYINFNLGLLKVTLNVRVPRMHQFFFNYRIYLNEPFACKK